MTTFDDILALVSGGESETVEFKATTGQRTEAAKTLSAMLNGRGGTTLFGVTDDGRPIGQQVSERTLESITRACEEIAPRFPPRIDRVVVPDRAGYEVIVVSVPQGVLRPYTYRGDAYLRSGASTVRMPDEIAVNLLLERAHNLDRWELGASGHDVDALDESEIMALRDDAIATNRARFDSSANVVDVLRALHLLSDRGRPNRAGVILFGAPHVMGGEYAMAGCHMVAVDDRVLREAFVDEHLIEEHLFGSLRRAVMFCRQHLANPVALQGVEARTTLEIPELVIREALANAFAHRDYATPGRIQLRVYSDRLEVVSPGGLHFGLTPTDLYRSHTSMPWNPLLLGALYRRGTVDQLGSGTMRMVRLCTAEGLGPPLFSATPTTVTCAIPRRGYLLATDGRTTPMEADDRAVLEILTSEPSIRSDIASRLGHSNDRIRTLLVRLQDLGVVHVQGHARGARWFLGPADPPD